MTGRLGFVAVLFAAAAGTAVVAAPSAGAAPAIQPCQNSGGTVDNSSAVSVSDVTYCLPFMFKRNVSIWQFTAGNAWAEVASGLGSATYSCKGTTRTVYQTRTVDFGTQQFYDTCG
jgi:hypothetical protein